MKTLPTIGARYRYAGKPGHVGPCVGIVRCIYPNHVPAPGEDESDDDCKYVRAPFTPEGYQVRFEIVGDLPTPFPYGHNGNRAFAPAVADIEPE